MARNHFIEFDCAFFLVSLFLCASLCFSACLFASLSVFLLFCSSLFLCTSLCFSARLFVSLHVSLFLCKSLCLSVCHFVFLIRNKKPAETFTPEPKHQTSCFLVLHACAQNKVESPWLESTQLAMPSLKSQYSQINTVY